MNCFQEPIIVEIANKKGFTPAQVVLGWHLQRGYGLIVKTVTEERMLENLNSAQVALSEDECKKIDELDIGARIFDPFTMQSPFFGG